MAIEAAAHPPLRRRQSLSLLAALGVWAMLPRAKASASEIQLAAAWEDRQGRFHVGLLSARPSAGQPLQVRASIEVPTRAHGLCPLPDGSLLAVARRPGDWLLRWRPGRATPPQWRWQEADRSFNGHALASPDGQDLYTTETALETGDSLLVVRDARTLATKAQWPTHGVDAHELVWDRSRPGAPALIVANGGVPTAPETGRVKRQLHHMDSSLVRLDARDGALQGQWRLSDPRLSLRHLAWSADSVTLGVALQAEHEQAAAKNAAPVLALFDGQTLSALSAPPALDPGSDGYGGSVAATDSGWAVSCPRAQGIANYGPDGAWQGLRPLREACALATRAGQLWAAGRSHSLQSAQSAQSASPLPHPHGPGLQGARLDNHWALVS